MNFQRFIPISKSDDEQMMVYGWASTPTLDKQGEIITVDAMAKALPAYMNFPTIREMHQPSAVGVTKEANIQSDKGLFIGAKIVDKNAWEKVKEGVYRGFSIGGRVLQQIDNVIDKIELTEISLVDVPANSEAKIEIYKSDTAVKTYAIPDQKELPIYTKNLVIKSMIDYLKTEREQTVQNRIIKAAQEFKIDTKDFESLCQKTKLELNTLSMLSTMTQSNMGKIIKVLKEANMELEKSKKQEEVEVKETEVVETEKEEVTKEVVEEVKEEEKEKTVDEVKETEVVVDEAKQTADVPEFMKRLEALETKMTEPVKNELSVDLEKIDSVMAGISKMASLMEKFDTRISALEAQPQPAKTKAVLVDKVFDKSEEVPVSADLQKINTRIQELVKMREENPGLYASDPKLQQEAFELLGKRNQIINKE